MSKVQFRHDYKDIISLENLLEAWTEFVRGKRQRKDVQEFEHNLMGNLIELHRDLASGTYQHSYYSAFSITDPKPRQIHKASVRDRILHHALYRTLYPFFDRTFIANSYSCRIDKGTYKAIKRFRAFAYKVSRNHRRTCWVLKCDIKKFFASINHGVLIGILSQYISDLPLMQLLEQIIDSFSTLPGVGLPLGNLTSQLFCNIYMNEFDQFVKHKLHAKYYIRYADDFVFLSDDREALISQIAQISEFLKSRLNLTLHPDKLYLKTFVSGVDFLGWVHFPDHTVIRTTTKRRMMKQLRNSPMDETLQSYLGLMNHGNTYGIKESVLEEMLTREDA